MADTAAAVTVHRTAVVTALIADEGLMVGDTGPWPDAAVIPSADAAGNQGDFGPPLQHQEKP